MNGTRSNPLYTHLILGQPGYGKSQMAAWEVARLGKGIIFSPTMGFPSVLPAEIFGAETRLGFKYFHSIESMTPFQIKWVHSTGRHVVYTGTQDLAEGRVPGIEFTLWLQERGRERQDARWSQPERWTVVIDEGMFFRAFHGRLSNEVSNFVEMMTAMRHYNYNMIIAVQSLQGMDPNLFGFINRFTFFYSRDSTVINAIERHINVEGVDKVSELGKFRCLQYHTDSVPESLWAVYKPGVTEQTVFKIEDIPMARKRREIEAKERERVEREAMDDKWTPDGG